MATVIVGVVAIMGAAVAAGGLAVSLIGFGVKGVVAGSIAAGMQSGIGNVVAGSAFAAAQSAGATGVMSTIGGGVVAVAGAAFTALKFLF